MFINLMRTRTIMAAAPTLLLVLSILKTLVAPQVVEGAVIRMTPLINDQSDGLIVFPPLGLARGEFLRLTLFNPGGEPVRARAGAHAGGANFLFMDGSVRGGAFDSFDLRRREIPMDGEAGTGRIQLLVTCTVDMDPEGASLAEFAPTLELVEESTGRTRVTVNDVLLSNVLSFEVRNKTGASMASEDVQLSGVAADIGLGFVNDVIMGIVHGEALRVTLFNPGLAPDLFPSRVKLFESNGTLIAESPDLIIPVGESRSFEVDRSSVPVSSELIGRLQVRVQLDIQTRTGFISSFPIDTGGLLASFEIIDTSSGRTRVHMNNLKQIGVGVANIADCCR